MTNYQWLCHCVDIYEAANNHRFYDALADASLNEAVNSHIFYPNDEALANLACTLLPAQNDRTIIQSCDNRWFHARFENWDAALWVYCPAQCTLRLPESIDWVKGAGWELSRGQAFANLEKEHVPGA